MELTEMMATTDGRALSMDGRGRGRAPAVAVGVGLGLLAVGTAYAAVEVDEAATGSTVSITVSPKT